MNKLREEILLKIEEMGLLLSKEVRDRVTEERMLRKQAMTDFVAEYKDLYAGHSMVALVDVEQSPLLGVVLAADLASGKSARDGFHEFAKGFTPEARRAECALLAEQSERRLGPVVITRRSLYSTW